MGLQRCCGDSVVRGLLHAVERNNSNFQHGSEWSDLFGSFSSEWKILTSGSTGFQRLDYVLAAAAKVGMRAILVLTNNWS